MPERPNHYSAFIWYHGDNLDPADLKAWLSTVKAETGHEGQLYIRHKEGSVTYMETYADLSEAEIQAIEKLAAANRLFAEIDRRCENFRPIGAA